MKFKLLFVFGLLLSVCKGYAQSDLSIGLSTGYDKNSNHLLNLNGDNYNSIPDFNVGLDVSKYIGKRIRLRGEIRYANISYTRDYGYPEVDDNIHLSKLSVNNISINPRFDFRLFSIKKLDLYATTGWKFEFSLGSWGRSTTYGGDTNQGVYFTDEYTNAMGGAIGGLIFKYNVTPVWGITLNPEYTYLLREFYSPNNTDMQRMSLNVGVEWKF